MAPRNEPCLDHISENDEACYHPQTPAQEHDDHVTSMLYQMLAEERYLALLMEQVESLCHEYSKVLFTAKRGWTALELLTMEKEIQLQRTKIERFRRVHEMLCQHINTLDNLQKLFYGNFITLETYVEQTRSIPA